MPVRHFVRLFGFVKSTIVGGIFVLVPLVLLSIVVGQAIKVAYDVVHPVVEWLPVTSVSTVSLALGISIAALILGCFLAGLLARTAVSQWLVGSLEQLILSIFPGYGLMKDMGQGWLGVEGKESQQPALVRLDDAQYIGFVMDNLADGRRVVFIPDVPNPWSGSLVIVDAMRVELLPVSTKQTLDCLRKLGATTKTLFPKLPAAKE